MEFKNILCILVVSLLMFGAVSAQKNVSDFQVDNSFKNVDNSGYYSLYLNGKQDAGVTVYKDFVDGEDNDAYDHLIHDDGRDYLTPDDDLKVNKNSDNTYDFTDYDHAEHGVAEVINVDGGEFVVVFWAKDTSGIDNAKLSSLLSQFNKDNNVKPISV